MKKVLVTGAALMLAGGIAATTAFAAAEEPGIKITGDARVRFYFMDSNARNFGNNSQSVDYALKGPLTLQNNTTLGNGTSVTVPGVTGNPYHGGQGTTGTDTVKTPIAAGSTLPAGTKIANGSKGTKSQTNFDSRVRVTIKGVAPGGSYAVVRMRIAESNAGDLDSDYSNGNTFRNSNIAADMAYIGIPFNDMFTVELGRYRSTYGPLPPSYNWFYDDVNLTGARGIIKIGSNVEINPFVEFMNEAQNADNYSNVGGGTTAPTGTDKIKDNDTIRFGAHVKAKVDKDWTIGGMLGYQKDNRNEILATAVPAGFQYLGIDNGNKLGFQDHSGLFGSFYVAGKAGNFGLAGEIAFTGRHLNNFNSWELETAQVNGVDPMGSADTGFGGFILPNFQIDKLNLAILLGFTQNGFQPDGAFGDGVLVGSIDNSVISQVRIGDYGDWLFGGLIASYQIRDDLKITGNLIYADINAWDTIGPNGDGPNTKFRSLGARGYRPDGTYGDLFELNNAWTISALMQYTISKGMDVYFSAGYLKASIDDKYNIGVQDDGIFAAATRFELKF